MEEESQEILLNSIANSGVKIPAGVSSVKYLTPASLYSISTQSLHLIDRNSSFPASLPENSVAERLKLCSALASAFKTLGFVGVGDISFHKFLYPSEEDLYELVRFLVGRLSDVEARENAVGQSKRLLKTPDDEKLDDTGPLSVEDVSRRVGNPLMMIQAPDSLKQSYMEKSGSGEDVLDLVEDVRRSSLRNNEHDFEHGQQVKSLPVHLPQMNCNAEALQDRNEMLVEKLVSRSMELQQLQEKLGLLKETVEMASDDRYPTDFYTNQLHEQVEAQRSNIVEMEGHWNAMRKPLEQKKSCLEETFCAAEPEAYAKFKKLEEIELELAFILTEKKRREEKLILLSAESEKQPNLASRKTYVQRIEEITKNSRKQDTDTDRILKETRELQLESNSIQERLHRTHAVVDEIAFREAKKDLVGQQAYRILTSIHDSFEQIADKLLATDRARREVADYEGRLATMTSRSVDIDKLKADLDTIRTENDLLETRLSNNWSKDSSQASTL